MKLLRAPLLSHTSSRIPWSFIQMNFSLCLTQGENPEWANHRVQLFLRTLREAFSFKIRFSRSVPSLFLTTDSSIIGRDLLPLVLSSEVKEPHCFETRENYQSMDASIDLRSDSFLSLLSSDFTYSFSLASVARLWITACLPLVCHWDLTPKYQLRKESTTA